MKQRISWILIISSSLMLPVPNLTNQSQAASPNIYEAMSGTNSTSMNSVAGSSDSIGLTGNWIKVNGVKSGSDPVRASVFTSSYNANLAFPTNSSLTVPANNTAAGTTSNTWSPFGSARALTSPISFDTDGTYYFSYLMYAPTDGGGNWGSAVAGLLTGIPVNNTDTSKSALYFGWTYQGAAIIPTCKQVITSTTTAICNWLPSAHASTVITAILTPNSDTMGSTSAPVIFSVVRRTNPR